MLRELSLRLVAEGVQAELEEHREQMGQQGPSGASERILVSAQYHSNGSIYIRRGQQIAKRLNGDLLVVVFMPGKRKLTKEAAAFKRSLHKMAKKRTPPSRNGSCVHPGIFPKRSFSMPSKKRDANRPWTFKEKPLAGILARLRHGRHTEAREGDRSILGGRPDSAWRLAHTSCPPFSAVSKRAIS